MKNYYWFLLIISLLACGTNGVKMKNSKDYAFVGEYTLGLEGPAVDSKGDLYFVNAQKNGTIGKVEAATKKFEIFIESLPGGSIANGIRIGNDGILYLADYVNHSIMILNSESKKLSIFANDSTMNQPNDIAITNSGLLFASDPNWANETGNLWRINAFGKIEKLESNMGTTNGIELAPGDSILYVNESAQRKVWAYDLNTSGEISNKRLLIEFEDFGLDGMRCDIKGNLYIARYGKGVVAVVSPKGELLYEVMLKSQKPTNVAFGGVNGKTVYITCQDRGYIEMFEANFQGRAYLMNN